MEKLRSVLNFITSSRFFGMLLFLFVLVAIPATVALLKQQQDIRNRAQTSCFIEVPISAKNTTTGECREFSSPCDVPEHWDYTPSCNPTRVTIYVKVPGIGTDGNKNPKNPERQMQVML